jgi:NADPH:quinone reductase-like Zn-dependent oxidoreductase
MAKAYVFTRYGGPETESLIDLPVPVPGPGDLLVALHAAAVNPADWKFREGHLRETVPLQLPAVFGIEGSGIVEQVGAAVTGFAVGDEVFGRTLGTGSYSEYTLIPAVDAAHKPPNVSFLDAGALTIAAGTAYDGIEQLHLHAGETLLITGIGGGVGVAAAQLAKRLGLTVIGTASAAKHDFVESLGAVHVTYGDGVADRVKAAAPNGIDALFDMVGGEAAGAVAALVGDPAKRVTAAYDEGSSGVSMSRVTRSPKIGELLDKLAELAQSGELSPKVTEVFALDRARAALAAIESEHATGKIAIQVLG